MMKRHVKRFGVHGFTLIEITLVIIVMGILAAAIAPMLAGVVGRAQADAERIKLKTLKEALLADALERGGFVDPLTSAANAGGVGKTYPGAQTRQYLATTYPARVEQTGGWHPSRDPKTCSRWCVPTCTTRTTRLTFERVVPLRPVATGSLWFRRPAC